MVWVRLHNLNPNRIYVTGGKCPRTKNSMTKKADEVVKILCTEKNIKFLLMFTQVLNG